MIDNCYELVEYTIKLNLMVLMVVVKLRIEEERQILVVEGH